MRFSEYERAGVRVCHSLEVKWMQAQPGAQISDTEPGLWVDTRRGVTDSSKRGQRGLASSANIKHEQVWAIQPQGMRTTKSGKQRCEVDEREDFVIE